MYESAQRSHLFLFFHTHAHSTFAVIHNDWSLAMLADRYECTRHPITPPSAPSRTRHRTERRGWKKKNKQRERERSPQPHMPYLLHKVILGQLLRTGLCARRKKHDAECHHRNNFLHNRHLFFFVFLFTYVYMYMYIAHAWRLCVAPSLLSCPKLDLSEGEERRSTFPTALPRRPN